jgi:internalin A
MFLSRWSALPAALLAALPLAASDPPKGVAVTTDGRGRPMVRLDCHDQASDARLAMLGANPKIEVVRLAGAEGFTDAGMAHVARLPNLQELSVIGSDVTDQGLRCLGGHRSLRSLYLRGLPITRAAAEALTTIPHLTDLTIRHATVEPAALKVLAGMKSLRTLHLYNGDLTDTDLTAARGFVGLTALEVGGKHFTPAALGLLGEPAALRDLTLTGQSLTGANAKSFAALVQLERLTLNDTTATPAAYDIIRELPRLRELTVTGPHTDADLDPLSRVAGLRVLHLHNTKITQAKTSVLRAAMPKTVVSPYGWKHTIDDLKVMSSDVETAPDGTVVAVEMICRRSATDEKLGVLQQFPDIKRLAAYGGPALTDAGLARLKSLPRLEELDIGSPEITDAGLKHLAECKSLRSVLIQNAKVTDAGIAELRKALPRVKIERE